MSKDQVETLYKCMVCPKAFASKQALRGHMNAHRGEDIRTTHIVVRGEKWDRFKRFCEDHNMTTCHMIDALITLALKGKEDGIVDVVGPNPVIFNLSQVFLGKPRSAWKVDLTSGIVRGPACPRCGSREIRTLEPEGVGYSEGSCLRCGARWLVTK